jgi:hypothetical protein
MTIYEYVATKNPIGAKTVLNSFGEKAVPRPDILAKQLANAVNKHGKDALFRIASVHPDMQLISEYNKQVNKSSEAVEEKSCGCEKKEVESLFSSAEGQEIKKAVETLSLKQDTLSNTPKESKSDSKDLMIIGAVAVIALALVMKK